MNRYIVTTKGKALCLVVVVAVGMASYFSLRYSYNMKDFAKIQDIGHFLLPQYIFQSQDGDGQNPLWWRKHLCKKEVNGTDKDADNAVPLKQLFRSVTPEKDRNVFLMDTACNPTPKNRVWCSVESWAKQNPDRQVWFLLTSGRLKDDTGLTSTLLQQYTNLQVVTADLNDMFRDTPLMTLFNSRKWTKTWPVELMSDMLRVLVLWWWGGVYSDTDVISVRTLTLPLNALGFENPIQLGSAFYSFQAHHPVLLRLMQDMRDNFKPHQWGSIGPHAITRVMIETCGKSMEKLIRKAPVTCPGNIVLHPASIFYPIRYNDFKYYFKPGQGKTFNETFSKAFALHFWNKMSKKEVIKVNSNSMYEVAAKMFCPITYKFSTAESNVL